MGFEVEKDLVLFRAEQGGLEVSVRKYDTGKPKVQIGPRSYVDKSGSRIQTKVGRLSLAEMQWLFGMSEEILKNLQNAEK